MKTAPGSSGEGSREGWCATARGLWRRAWLAECDASAFWCASEDAMLSNRRGWDGAVVAVWGIAKGSSEELESRRLRGRGGGSADVTPEKE